MPATLQATIAARIDRLDPVAKQTLNAAAVIGLRFGAEQLALLAGEASMDELIGAELVDQVRFTPRAEYAFHHPLVQAVAYESQLKSDLAELHRRLAVAIEQRHPDALDENAALIAQHLEVAGDLRAAFGWHMRAGGWLNYRDIRAACMSWRRARDAADGLPADDPDRTLMRIAPRTLLCGVSWRVRVSDADTDFEELRDLCATAGDNVSLAIGMAGLMTALLLHSRFRESVRVASDCSGLIELITDPAMTVAPLVAQSNAKWQAGEAAEGLRLAQRAIDLAEGDPTKGNLVVGSPLALATALRGATRCCLGLPAWKEDLDRAVAMARAVDATSYTGTLVYESVAVHVGALLPDAAADHDTVEAMEMAEHSGDDFAVDYARLCRGVVLINQGDSHRETALALFAQYREGQLRHGYADNVVRIADVELAREKVRIGDIDGAIQLARAVVDYLFDTGEMITRGEATRVLVEALLQRGGNADLEEAQGAIDRLAAVPTDPGFVLFEIPLLRLRALMARANGDEDGYREFADRYLKRATDVGYEGHIAMAQAM